MSYLMDYGPDWPPAPPRRRGPRVFGREFRARAAFFVGTFLIVAALAIISDHRPQRIDFPMPTHSSTPATVASTPRSHHPGNP